MHPWAVYRSPNRSERRVDHDVGGRYGNRACASLVGNPPVRYWTCYKKINASLAARDLHSYGMFVVSGLARMQPRASDGRKAANLQERLLTRVEAVTDALAVTSARGLWQLSGGK